MSVMWLLKHHHHQQQVQHLVQLFMSVGAA
jgi:hypothetical protein